MKGEKSLIKSALDSLNSGNVRRMKTLMKEAILAKAKKALEKRETEIAKEYLNKK